jgi:hypothetical protein
MLPDNELQEIVNFIRSRSEKLKIKEWTDEQIAAYILEKSSKKQCIVLHQFDKPAGVIFFDLLTPKLMYIEQFWAAEKFIVKCFLKILKDNFPTVEQLHAWHQRRGRTLKIPVKDFIRIYG